MMFYRLSRNSRLKIAYRDSKNSFTMLYKSGNKARLSIGKNTPLDLAFEWIIKNIDHLEDNTMIIKKLEA